VLAEGPVEVGNVGRGLLAVTTVEGVRRQPRAARTPVLPRCAMPAPALYTARQPRCQRIVADAEEVTVSECLLLRFAFRHVAHGGRVMVSRYI